MPAPPPEDLPSCGDAGGVNDSHQDVKKFSNPSRRNKKTAPAEASAVLMLLPLKNIYAA
tara:strand:+ start:545 stop:721 length:177 start_codon:yes stop_codon:yes gene_type:complete